VFDLDTKLLEQHYHNANWRNGYADIFRVLSRHRFANVQGTAYLSERGVRQAHGTLALQEVAIRYPWFDKCVSNVQFYDLADDFNAQFHEIIGQQKFSLEDVTQPTPPKPNM